jgi:hypothetical protein
LPHKSWWINNPQVPHVGNINQAIIRRINLYSALVGIANQAFAVLQFIPCDTVLPAFTIAL